VSIETSPFDRLKAWLRNSSALVTIVLITLAILLADGFYLTRIYNDGRQLAQKQSQLALHAFEQALSKKGERFAVRDGQLRVDDYLLNDDTEIIDQINEIFTATASLFLGRERVATSAADADGRRLTGTRMDENVARVVYGEDRPYFGEAVVLGAPHFTSYKPLHDASGKPIGAIAVGINQDLFYDSFNSLRYDVIAGSALIESFLLVLAFFYYHERRHYERQRRASAERYQALFEVATEGIFLLGGNDTIVECNPAAVHLFGGSREDLLGATPFDVSPAYQPDGRISVEAGSPVLEAVRKGESQFITWQHRRFNGELFDAELSLCWLEDPAGPLVQATIRDVTEKQKAQVLLQESEQRYRTLFEMNGVATTLFDRNLRLVLANREFYALSAISAEDVHKGVSLNRLFTDPHIFDDILAKIAFEPDSKVVIEGDLVRSGGEMRQVILHLAAVPGTRRYLATLHDVTPLKALGASLKTQLDFFQTLINTIPNPIFYKDRAGRYLGCNRNFEKGLGVVREEIVGKSVYDLSPPELAAIYAEKDDELFAHPGIQVYESQMRTASGEFQDVVYYKATFNDETGKVAGLVGVILDITEQKRIEATLRESEERFHQLFIQNHDAIVMFNPDNGIIIDANESASRLFGYSHPQFLSMSPKQLLDPGVFERIVPRVLASYGDGRFQFELLQARRADGESFPASIWGKIVTLRSDKVIYCSVRDLSEKVQLEEAMRSTQAKLIHTNKMTSLGLLTSSVGHEINNPNSYIAVNAALLGDAWRDALPVLQQYRDDHGDFALGGLTFTEMEALIPRLCSGIVDGSQRISNIVKELKDFVREEKWGGRQLVDINDIVQAATSILWHHIHRHTDHFKLELASQPLKVLGSLQQLEQVVINLVMNALQALPDKSREVIVRTETTAKEVRIVVQDQGKGMTPEVQERLTEPFFSTRIDEGGTGLGLYISTSVLAEHGGKMTFDSVPGEGTTVIVTLPAAADKVGGSGR